MTEGVRSLHVFLSYASEYHETAEQLYLTLRNSGHDVFFDRASLPPGKDYNPAILDRIRSSDLMVFLISPESVEDGSYARTELRFARDAWPEPQGHVLPVMVAETPLKSIPMYLRAVTYLKPEGNIAAEVAAVVNDLAAGIRSTDTMAAHIQIIRETAQRVNEAESAARRVDARVDSVERKTRLENEILRLENALLREDQRWRDRRESYKVHDGYGGYYPTLGRVGCLSSIGIPVIAFLSMQFGYVGLFPAVPGGMWLVYLWVKALTYHRAEAEHLRRRAELVSHIGNVRRRR